MTTTSNMKLHLVGGRLGLEFGGTPVFTVQGRDSLGKSFEQVLLPTKSKWAKGRTYTKEAYECLYPGPLNVATMSSSERVFTKDGTSTDYFGRFTKVIAEP